MKKTSVLSNSLIWFGAAVSIAEIQTGAMIAPLGWKNGIAAVLLGHIIGCALLYLAGLIGAITEKPAMETVKLTFGKTGSAIFSSLNILQLVGWTAVMIIVGSSAANSVVMLGAPWVWSVIIAALIMLWVLVGFKHIDKLNIIAVGALFALTVVLSVVIFGNNAGGAALAQSGKITFGGAVELSVAMPLSWLPLISDYTSRARRPRLSCAVSCIVYFAAGSWMYIIGMGAAIFAGTDDIAKIMMSASLGVAALVTIVFSTVTTTFLDVYSAGVSSESITKKLPEKYAAAAVCIVGAVLAVFVPMTKYEDFLYLIGSVFAPMIALQVADFLILKNDCSDKHLGIVNMLLWAGGFALYRVFMRLETPVGVTLPVMLICIAVCVAIRGAMKIHNKKRGTK